MCKKFIYLTFFFAFCPMAMASDIAISTQAGWMGQGHADTEAQQIVNSVTGISIEVFDSTQLNALATWVQDHTGDGTPDLLIMFGIFPSSIYPAGNAQPDGSIAENFLDDGNVIINTGDYIFYVGSAGNNDAGGLANMMDVPGAAMWGDDTFATMFIPTADGQLYTPSLTTLPSNRPWFPGQFAGTDWEVELILAQTSDGSQVHPAILHNTVTDGRVGVFFQCSLDTDIQPRGEVISEWINNYFLTRIAAGNPYARRPNPKDGAIGVTSALLQWKAGDTAAYHDVYFGTNPTPGPDEFRGRQSVTQSVYYHADGLVPGTTYYWRIDEVEADETTIHTGNVWSFSAPALSASDPDPPDGARWIQSDVTLSWNAGWNSVMYQVYLSADLDAVTNGTTGADKGIVGSTSYAATGLDLDTTHYWRVDAFDDKGAWHTGDIWSFTTMPVISITDPNLLGWWTLDEGEGTTALDWSGHGNHGVLRNEPQWVFDGYHGGALAFDGLNDYVSVPLDVSETEYTATLWFNTTNGDCGLMAVVDSDLGAGGHDRHIYLTGGNIRIRLWDTEEIWTTGLDLANGLWHHVAYTYGATIGGQRVYVDGVLQASGTKDASDFNWQRHVNIGFSNDATNDYFEGVLDDVRIYDKTLTEDEIAQVMRGDPALAWNPKPTNGSTTDVEKALPVSWSPGEKAAKHDVYFGTDRDAVSDADTSDTTGVYRGRQDLNSYTPPEELEWGQTYYWRVDEYNTDATISVGRVWTFTVTDYLIVDDFEPYDDFCNRIFYTWTDGWGYSADPTCGVSASAGNGTGSTVGNLSFPYAEQTIVHGGRQSMPFEYNNTGAGGKARYSEAQREWASPQDWTRKAVKALTLYFYGGPANAAEQLYVALEDTAGQAKVVNHPNLEAVQRGAWQEWNIELTQFSGVDLMRVKKLYIGLGNRVSPQLGGTGKIYIDDIRLYRPRCVPLMLRPDADIAEPYDCKVGYKDVGVLADEWLLETQLQDWEYRAAYWDSRYRTNWATDANSITVRDGLAAAGYTILDADQLKTWMDARIADGKLSVVVFCRDNAPDTVVESVDATCTLRRYLDAGGKIVFYADIPFWDIAHADGTWDNPQTAGASDILGFDNTVVLWDSNTQVTLTAAGIGWGLTQTWASVRPIATTDVTVLATDAAGNAAAWVRHYLPGDTARGFVRLYDRGGHPPVEDIIRAAECKGYLAADLYQDGVVDFKDFAVLADAWLEEILWP